jgi:hypothetical protein
MRAIVTIYNSSENTFIGEWCVEVDGENLRTRHFPQPPDRELPRAHVDYHHEVTSLIHAYLAGYHRKTDYHKWVEKPEIKKVEVTPEQIRQIHMNHAH